MRLKKQKYWIALSHDEWFEMRYKDALGVLKRILKEEGYENAEDIIDAFVCSVEKWGCKYVLTFIPQFKT